MIGCVLDDSKEVKSLRPIGHRLLPPHRLGAIYSLKFYSSQETCNRVEQSRMNETWLFGAGKGGIVSLWDCYASPPDSGVEKIEAVISWKAHGGHWVSDVRFIPPYSSQ
mmetsp:Transcript_22332/g.45205  ORF Transcript_22332/g.45205 Transcript_22332/m.45205 type:complete len:109 (+) Transcript_22332:54-380(+)